MKHDRDHKIPHIGQFGLWWLKYDPKPIPFRCADYEYFHDDYDGPGDARCGVAATIEGCLEAIREIENDTEREEN